MSESSVYDNQSSLCADKQDDIVQENKQGHLGGDCLNVSSPQSSPNVKSQELSPCAIETIKKVNNLKDDFRASFSKIEKNIEKESTAENPTDMPSQVKKNDNPPVMNEKTVQSGKPVKADKDLFKDRVKPQRKLESNSRLLVGTRSNSAKRAAPPKREDQNHKDSETTTKTKPRCASAGVRRRPTQPQAPTFMSRPSRPSNVTLTSEEIEWQKLEKEKKDAEKQMKSYQKTFQVLKSKGAIPTTVRSVKELTIPMTPSFPTDQRVKRIIPNEHKEEDVKKATTLKAHSGPTVPVPFQFATTKRHGEVEKSNSDSFTSGEVLDGFNRGCRSTYVPQKTSTGLTKPEAPIFRTEERSKSVGRPKPLSREEIEEKQLQEAKAHAFKAKPVNKKIFESMGVNGVPKVPVKQPTTAEEFHLTCDERAEYRKQQKTETLTTSEEFMFKARRMPDFSKSSRPQTPTNTPKLTEAHSPKLHGGQRASSAPARRQKISHEEMERRKRIEASAWKQKIRQKPELTCPVDVKLKTEERGKASQQALHDRIRRQMEEEKRASEVHATPLNEKILKKSFTVSASQKELTEFSEFKLKTDDRHNRHVDATIKSMEEMQENFRKSAEFHARPLPSSTHKPGFAPKPSDKEPVTPQNVHLQSEQRSLQRKSFDAAVKKSKEEEKELMEKRRADEREKENMELQMLRRTPASQGGMTFKASKRMDKDPFPVKHTKSKPLTEPESPNLSTALRTRVNQ